MVPNTSRPLRLTGGQVLLASGELEETSLLIENGMIAAVGRDAAPDADDWDVRGRTVFPGMVDIHGDAFERQLMPRPGVTFDPAFAFAETDRQLAANGITTAYHGITHSWEPGLRSRDAAARLIETLQGMNGRFAVEHRAHLRWETFNLDGVEELLGWMRSGAVHLLAFNNHLPNFQAKRSVAGGLTTAAQRAGMSDREFGELVERVAARAEAVPAAIALLAAAARDLGVAMASHDDYTRKDRHDFAALGCGICEFPMTQEALSAAADLDNPVVLGAPNVVRGGSQFSDRGINAADAVENRPGAVLASDYFYPAMLRAPFALHAQRGVPIGDAWAMVSRNAAEAAGLSDRGEIAVGKRADLVVLTQENASDPRVELCLSGGRFAFYSAAR